MTRGPNRPAQMGSAEIQTAFPMGYSHHYQLYNQQQQQQQFAASNSLMMNMTSSISDFGVFPRVNSSSSLGDIPVPRRASLQFPPTHRYQPYPMSATGVQQYFGLGSSGGSGNASGNCNNPASGSGAAGTNPVSVLGFINQFGASSGVSPLSTSALPSAAHSLNSSGRNCGGNNAATIAPAMQVPGVSLSDISPLDLTTTTTVGDTRAESESQQQSITPTSKRFKEMTLHPHLQVKPTPSLPEYLLAPHQRLSGVVQPKQFLTASPESVSTGKRAETLSADCPGAAEAGDMQACREVVHQKRQKIKDEPLEKNDSGADMGSVGDISVFFTFSEASEQKPELP
ncbi:hypothetical protein GGI07_001560 [Coemansia sp. Benny D115]|nr:hypothetical protein GGI07_001560 [Coemansia sp. Benny D115]